MDGESIQRVPILAQCVRNKPPVEGVCNAQGQCPRYRERAHGRFILELHRGAARGLYHHLEVAVVGEGRESCEIGHYVYVRALRGAS
jgi:hypothetical protein